MASPKMTIKAQKRALRRAKSRFGIPGDACLKLIDRSEGCQICGNGFNGPEPYLDHDHKTGAFRGFLCKRCNFVLGFARDKAVVLQRAVEYLQNPPAYGNRAGRRNRDEQRPRRWIKPAPGYTPFFKRLNSARILKGATPKEVCDSIQVSLPTWYRWQRGSDPRRLQRQAAEAYIGTAYQSDERESAPTNGEIRHPKPSEGERIGERRENATGTPLAIE